MSETIATIKAKDVAKELKVSVTVTGLFWPRVAVGLLLVRIGAWLAGFGGVHIE